MSTTTWPEGVIARYLTVAGSALSDPQLHVEISEQSGYTDHIGPTETVAICKACGTREIFEWIAENWDEASFRFVRETVDPGGKDSAQQARVWAQSHAEKCRAIPNPNA